MTPNETPVKQETSKPRPVLHWAELKKTAHWLLCLTVVNGGWCPEQQDDAIDEVTETEYDEAVATTKAGYDTCAKAHGRSFVKALVHETLYVAIVVRKLKSTEDTAVSNMIAEAAEASDKQGAEMLLRQFDNVVVFPPPARIAELRDKAPKALKLVLPRRWQGSLGAEAEASAKKRLSS